MAEYPKCPCGAEIHIRRCLAMIKPTAEWESETAPEFTAGHKWSECGNGHANEWIPLLGVDDLSVTQ